MASESKRAPPSPQDALEAVRECLGLPPKDMLHAWTWPDEENEGWWIGSDGRPHVRPVCEILKPDGTTALLKIKMAHTSLEHGCLRTNMVYLGCILRYLPTEGMQRAAAALVAALTEEPSRRTTVPIAAPPAK